MLNVILSKIEPKVKSFINSIRIPSLLSFVVSKKGEINPDIEDVLKNAPTSSKNWERIKLGKKVFGDVKVWMILALPLVMLAVKYGSQALQFFIEIAAQGIMLIPLLGIGYYIYRSFKKK